MPSRIIRMATTIAICCAAACAQSPQPPAPKHPRWHRFVRKVKRDAIITAEVAGAVVITAVAVVAAGQANVKVY